MGNRVSKSAEEKQQIVEESKTLGLAETARKYELSHQTLKYWHDMYAPNYPEEQKPEAGKPSAELKELQLENQKLKALLADKEQKIKIKIELLKKASYNKPTEQ